MLLKFGSDMIAPTQVFLYAGSQKAKRAMTIATTTGTTACARRQSIYGDNRPSFSSAARRRQFIDSAAGYTGKAGRDDQENHSTNRKAGGAFHGSQSQCRLDAFDSGQASDDVGVQSLQVLHVSKNDAQ